jgi:CRP/FNR family cyclic AMP-dependent transcriptional regulator
MKWRRRRSGLGQIYADGEEIVRQGDVGNEMFVIQSGKVGVYIESNGHEEFLRYLGKGEVFGELALFDQQERSATIRAKGTAQVLTLDKRTMLRRFYEDPSLAYNVVETLTHRVRQLTDELTAARSGHEPRVEPAEDE